MRSVSSASRVSCGFLALSLALGTAAQAAEPGVGRGAAATAPRPAAAAPARAAPAPEQFADGIAAVVNRDIITLRELNAAVRSASGELSRQGIQVPDQAALQHQVLQRLIMQRLMRQEATRMGIRVDGAQIDRAISSIAARNNINIDQLRAEVGKSGITWDQYRQNIGDEILTDRLRQRVVDANIVISDPEVDAYLKEQQRRRNGGLAQGPGFQGQGQGQGQGAGASASAMPQAAGPQQLALAQILVRVPENTPAAQVAVLRKKAEDILARVKQGGDFAAIAAAVSEGPEALQGGVMGERPLDGWPDLFLNAVNGLGDGQVSGIVQSANGFHILKVLARSGAGAPGPAPVPAPRGPDAGRGAGAPGAAAPQGPMEVTQTHARHILIKTSAVMSDDQARQRLELLRQRIVAGGEKFETLARQNSQDASAPQGGDLGWLTPGETVPPFEAAMNTLQINEVSEPVQSPFGWHLIQVLERRQKDVADEMQRMQARRILFERRAEPAFEEWLDQLRDQAYIDNRVEKERAAATARDQ